MFTSYEYEDDVIGILCSPSNQGGYDIEYDRAERAVTNWVQRHHVAQIDPGAAAPRVGFDADPSKIADHIFNGPEYWQR